jgi:DNA relaxase NicK
MLILSRSMSEKEFIHFVPYSSRAPLTSTSKLYFHLAILCFSFQNHFFHSCKALHGTDVVMIVGDVSFDDHIHSGTCAFEVTGTGMSRWDEPAWSLYLKSITCLEILWRECLIYIIAPF